MIRKNLFKTAVITMSVLTLALGMTGCGSKKASNNTDTQPMKESIAVVQEQTTKTQTEDTTIEPTSEEAVTEAEVTTEEAVEAAVNDTQEDTNIEAPADMPAEEPLDTSAEPNEPAPEPTPVEPETEAPAPVVYTKDNPLVIKVANSVEVKTENGECLGVGHSMGTHYAGYPHWVGDDGYIHDICIICGNEVVEKIGGAGEYGYYNLDGTFHDC